MFHVHDDVLLIAQAAVGEPVAPRLERCPIGWGWVIAEACRWYAFEVRSIDDSGPRTEIDAEVVGSGRLRDFFGFNRAKHAVIEVAILATRLHITPPEEVRAELARAAQIVAKTAGPREREAYEFLEGYIARSMPSLDEGRT